MQIRIGGDSKKVFKKLLSASGKGHEESWLLTAVTKMSSNTNNALVSLTVDSSLLVIKAGDILLNDKEVICYGKIHVCKIRDLKSQAKNPKIKTYACEVLLVHSKCITSKKVWNAKTSVIIR